MTSFALGVFLLSSSAISSIYLLQHRAVDVAVAVVVQSASGACTLPKFLPVSLARYRRLLTATDTTVSCTELIMAQGTIPTPKPHDRSRPEPDDDEEDHVEKMMRKTGCLELHYAVQECMAENRDWRKCQDQVATFRKCINDSAERQRKAVTNKTSRGGGSS